MVLARLPARARRAAIQRKRSSRAAGWRRRRGARRRNPHGRRGGRAAQAAPQDGLEVHPRGRLRAVRVGKAYRIARKRPRGLHRPARRGRAGARPSDRHLHRRHPGRRPRPRLQAWARTIPAALNAKDANRPPVRADIVYDPERAHLKIVLVSSPEAAGGLLKLVQFLLEQWGR